MANIYITHTHTHTLASFCHHLTQILFIVYDNICEVQVMRQTVRTLLPDGRFFPLHANIGLPDMSNNTKTIMLLKAISSKLDDKSSSNLFQNICEIPLQHCLVFYSILKCSFDDRINNVSLVLVLYIGYV